MAEQNRANHGKFLPPFRFCVVPVLTINLIYSLYWSGKMGFAQRGILQVLVVAALAVGFLSARVMALKVQNRGIRLEERLRYERGLPPELKPRIGEFPGSQLGALRFSGDAELPALAPHGPDDKNCDV